MNKIELPIDNADQDDSTDPEYLAWVEGQIAQGQEEMKDPSKRISASAIWREFGLDH